MTEQKTELAKLSGSNVGGVTNELPVLKPEDFQFVFPAVDTEGAFKRLLARLSPESLARFRASSRRFSE